MSIALMVRLAARLRALSEAEFIALKKLVDEGSEDPEFLGAIAEAISDCLDLTNAFNESPKLRLVGQG
jgi:hypothetical protein